MGLLNTFFTHFGPLLAWFAQYILSCILCPHLHGRVLVNTGWHAFYVLAGIKRFRCPSCHGRGLVNIGWDIFCVLAGMGLIWSTQVEIFLCPRSQGRVWSTLVDLNFLSLLALQGIGQHIVSWLASDGFGEHMLRVHFASSLASLMFSQQILRNILYLLVIWEDRSTQFEIYFVSSLAWDGFFNTCWDT